MSPPLGYFLTWTCYGTWLHGDPRGSVNRHFNEVGYETLRPNAALQHHEAAQASGPPVHLDNASRAVIERAIRDHCAFRHWCLHAVNVRTNHAHVVVTCPCETPPDQVLVQFKSWATRRLREAGLFAQEADIWTKGGSKRWLNDGESLARAVDYVLNQQ
jgi:REP element-mobilizing transposase RayT